MNLLKKIFNPLSTQRRLDNFAWSKDLDALDDIGAIEYCTKRLNEDVKKNAFNNAQYVNALIAIDEKVHITVEKITAHYINIDHLSAELEARIANAVFLYHRLQFLIYNTLIEKLAPSQPDTLPIMLARAISNATEMVKWRFYSYQSAPVNVWLQISKLYLIAEKLAMLDEPIQVYADQASMTIASAYINACMLGNLQSLSFQRKQLQLVSQKLSDWTSKISIQSQFNQAQHLFYVDTASDAPAKRIRNFKPADSYRYWSLDKVHLKIELCLSMIEYQMQPQPTDMKELISNKYAISTLETLRSEWSHIKYKRQRRSTERVKTDKLATAHFGFEGVCNFIKKREAIQVQLGKRAYSGERSFEERLASHYLPKDYVEPSVIYFNLEANQSTIVDESSIGFGMHLSKQASNVCLGMLVGVVIAEQKDDIRIGVICSIKPSVGDELHVGISLLSAAAFSAECKLIPAASTAIFSPANTKDIVSDSPFKVSPAFNNTVEFTNHHTGFSCLYLPKELSTSKQDSLIISKPHYNVKNTYLINISDVNTPVKPKQVKLTEILSYHDNWLQVSYRVIGSPTSS